MWVMHTNNRALWLKASQRRCSKKWTTTTTSTAYNKNWKWVRIRRQHRKDAQRKLNRNRREWKVKEFFVVTFSIVRMEWILAAPINHRHILTDWRNVRSFHFVLGENKNIWSRHLCWNFFLYVCLLCIVDLFVSAFMWLVFFFCMSFLQKWPAAVECCTYVICGIGLEKKRTCWLSAFTATEIFRKKWARSSHFTKPWTSIWHHQTKETTRK